MPTPQILLRFLPLLPFLLYACGTTPTPADAGSTEDVPDGSFGFETTITTDIPVLVEDLGQPDLGPDAPQDTGPKSDVLAVLPEVPTEVTIGTTQVLKVKVDHNIGVDGPPTASEELTFLVDGQPLPVGAIVAPKGQKQATISIWKTLDNGEFALAAVRPGSAKLVVRVDGIDSAPFTVTTTWPTTTQLTVSTALFTGTAPTMRVPEQAPDTVKLQAKLFQPGGLDAAVRFPLNVVNGTQLDLGAPPSTGQLQVTATIVTPQNQNKPFNPVQGALWMDQTDKGLFRGSFLGRTVDQTPVTGVFVAERDGDFGVDVLDDPTQLEKSTTTTPISDAHVSRVSLSAIGGGKALLTYRRVLNATQAELVRVLIDAKTGAVDKTLPTIAAGAKAFVQKSDGTPKLDGNGDLIFSSALGWTAAGTSNGQILFVWEGKKGKDIDLQPAEIGLWMRAMTVDGALPDTGKYKVFGQGAVKVGPDECMDSCHPQVLTLPNARFLVLWSPPTGGVYGRRVDGDFTFLDLNPTQLIAPPATAASGVTLDATLGLTWSHPDLGAFFRAYTVNPKALSSVSEEKQMGATTTNGPMPGAGIFGGGAPGFLGFALDGPMQNNLKMRRYDFSGSPVVGEIAVTSDVDRFLVATGQPPQIALLERVANANSGPLLRIRKFTTTTAVDGGTQLGPVVPLGAVSKLPLIPALCYVPEVDIYIAAWSGDLQSEGVWFQRFR